MKFNKQYQLIFFLMGWVLFIPGITWGITFTSQESFSVSTITSTHHDIIETDMAGGYQLIQPSLSALLPKEVDIDALDFITPATLVFSLQEDANLPGVGQVADEDLLYYNGDSITLIFDGSANGLPRETDIDAADIIGLSALTCSISLREDATLPGIGFVSRNDAIRYVQGVGFTAKDFNGVTAGVPLETNLDGFSRLNGTNYVLSFNAAAKFGGTLYNKSDLVQYNISGSSFSSYFDAAANGIPPGVNIQDIEVSPDTPVELCEFMITEE